MKLIENKRYKMLIILISIPVLFIAQYYLYKFGILSPMIKGAEIDIVNGDYIKDIDKYIIKLNDTIYLSDGDYIKIPSYAKEPNIWFNVLDNSGVLKLEGNKITAMKEGISSIAIMKNGRILKKADIKVVDPQIKLTNILNGNLKYVGDSASIISTVESNYDRFKEKEKVTYESTDESIIKVDEGKLEAVGVGSANIIIKAKDQEEVIFFKNIQAKVASIDINDEEIQVGDTFKLKPKITTNPKNLKHPRVIYELVDNKIKANRAIRLYKDGTVVAIREGSERVKISCGDKEKIITIKVVKKSITNSTIENLKYTSYDIMDNKAIISLEWDYIEGIYDYDIELRNNALGEKEFKLYHNIKIIEDDVSSGKIRTTIELDLIDSNILDISLRVVGKNSLGNTKPSNIVNIKLPSEDITDLSVNNLYYELDEVNNTVRLVWDKIDLQDISYSIYVKNNLNNESGFLLLQDQILENEYKLDLNNENVDLDIYVKAYKGGKYSKESNFINIKK